MASFSNFGLQETDGFTLQNSPLEVPDAVYEAGDPVTVSGGGTDYMTTFVGYEESTNYPIFRIINGGDQLIGTDISGGGALNTRRQTRSSPTSPSGSVSPRSAAMGSAQREPTIILRLSDAPANLTKASMR